MYKSFTEIFFSKNLQSDLLSDEILVDSCGVPSVRELLNRYASGVPVSQNDAMVYDSPDNLSVSPAFDGDSDIIDYQIFAERMHVAMTRKAEEERQAEPANKVRNPAEPDKPQSEPLADA